MDVNYSDVDDEYFFGQEDECDIGQRQTESHSAFGGLPYCHVDCCFDVCVPDFELPIAASIDRTCSESLSFI